MKKAETIYYPVTASTRLKEAEFDRQRFKKDEVVRLRGSMFRGKGVVVRAAVQEEGGVRVKWDCDGTERIHNPRYLQNVWLDEDGKEIDD